MAAAMAIVRSLDRNQNRGPILITTNWAKSIFFRLNFVKRKDSSTSKMTTENFEAVKEKFLLASCRGGDEKGLSWVGLQLGPNGNQCCPRIVVDYGRKGIKAIWYCSNEWQVTDYCSILKYNGGRVPASTGHLPGENTFLSPSLQVS